MLTLLASAAIVLYTLIPGAMYRFIFSFFVPIKAFQRTKIEEITFSASACLIPGIFTLTLFSGLVWICNSLHIAWSIVPRAADYEKFFAAAYSEQCFSCGQSDFWQTFRHVFWSQTLVLGLFYMFVAGKACLYGCLSQSIHKLLENEKSRLAWFAKHFLMPNVSEWYFLLTAAMFRPESRLVMVDIMTSEDRLYRGRVDPGGYFLDKDGDLSGILLKEASRFDRLRYLEDQKAGKELKPEQYWKSIPGANWYIPHSKILNLNIRYELPLLNLVQEILEGLKIRGRVTIERPHSPGSQAHPDFFR